MTEENITSRPTRLPRLAVARWAIDALPARIQEQGVFHAAQPNLPASWRLAQGGCRLLFAPGALLAPDDPELSALVDVWLDVGGKVLSVSWFPKKLWLPPRISTLKPGDWLYRLGWQPAP